MAVASLQTVVPALLAAGLLATAAPPRAASAEARAGAADAIGSNRDSNGDLQQRLQRMTEQRSRREAAEEARQRSFFDDATHLRAAPLSDPNLRRSRIEAYRPSPRSSGRIPANVARGFELLLAGSLEWLGLHEPSRDAYGRAIGLGHDGLDAWRGLGRMRVLTGDPDGAEGALLAALEKSEVGSASSEWVEIHRELAELYLLMGRSGEAGVALEQALARSPGSPRLERLLARARHEVAPYLVAALATPALAWPETRADRLRAGWERSLRHAYMGLPKFLQNALDSIARLSTARRGPLVPLGGIALLVAGWLAVRRWQRRGDLTVTVSYPDELTGIFSIRLATQPGKFKRVHRNAKQSTMAGQQGSDSTRTEHYEVSRETQFRGLHPQLYYVTVDGLLRDPTSDDIAADPFDEQAVLVEPKGMVHLDFDMGPRESVLDVRIAWDKGPARDAAVSARGTPQSLRYARDGSTRLHLPKGRHTIVIGSGDRVAEREVELDSFRPTLLEIDLGITEHLIFKGCPPAVEPYIHGDLGTAARALERDGHSDLSNLLLAKLHREQGQTERAAEHFEQAEQPREAAALYAELERYEDAARLYQQSGELVKAGEMLRAGGDLLRAGECFRQAGDFENAIRCFETANDIPRWIDAVEHSGDVFAAARLAVEHGDRGRTFRLLQQIQPDHPHHSEACEMLAEAYLQEGHRDLAVSKIEEQITTSGLEQDAPDLHWKLAGLLEMEGEFGRALEVLSGLREREPTYPNIATRIEALRKRQSELEQAQSAAASSSAPTAFLSESRYEIIEEIGRGGMGVVLKARDTRLQRTVALKRLPETMRDHPKAIELFLREAQSAARLNHPNIVTVYDTDQEDGFFFITMELLEGVPINQILKQRGRISARNVAQLGLQIASGLEYAHSKGIVHRDIKSANLFFTLDKVVKIMDFGLAKMMEEVRRGTTVIGGTPYYMAPEQAAGDSVDQRADLYAFGVTLYELATGSVPFTEGDVTYHHRHTPVPDPRTRVAEVPAPLAELLMQMLEKQPEDRIASATRVREQLEALAR